MESEKLALKSHKLADEAIFSGKTAMSVPAWISCLNLVAAGSV